MVGLTKAERLRRAHEAEQAARRAEPVASNAIAPFVAAPDADDFDLHTGIVDHFDLGRHYAAAMREIMEGASLSGVERDRKTVRAIRFLKASLSNPDVLNAVLMLIAIPGALIVLPYCLVRVS